MTRNETLQRSCQEYLNSRRSNYTFRCRRFKAVADELLRLGLDNADMLVDIGAGRCDFDYYLRTARKWRGRYIPVDGAIDGTDLEHWRPVCTPEWYTAIELIEHLENPLRLVREMQQASRKGVVLTTPNPYTTDVLGMDYTHKTAIYPEQLSSLGFKVSPVSLFGTPNDTLLATWSVN